MTITKVIRGKPSNVKYLLHRAVAQLGRALPWGGRGREFKSLRSDFDF